MARRKGRFFSIGAAQLWRFMSEQSLSKEELARRLGTNSGTLSHWLYGNRRPGIMWASRIEGLVGVPYVAWTQRDKAFRLPRAD